MRRMHEEMRKRRIRIGEMEKILQFHYRGSQTFLGRKVGQTLAEWAKLARFGG